MYKPETNILILFFLVVVIALSPFWSLGFFSELNHITEKDFAGVMTEFLSPTNFYDSIKNNFSVSPFGKNIVAPQQFKENVLSYPSSKMQNFTKGVEDETGVNLPKFLRWFARSIGSFFSLFGDLLKKIGGGS